MNPLYKRSMEFLMRILLNVTKHFKSFFYFNPCIIATIGRYFMVSLGKICKLVILSKSDQSLVLDGADFGELWLPIYEAPDDSKIGMLIEVFVYRPSADEVAVTTKKPIAEVGDCGLFRVVSVNDFGAFLDLGIDKDLFVPFNEQRKKLRAGSTCIAFVYLDRYSQRLTASTKLNHHLLEESDSFEVGQKVDLKIWERTEIGFKAIINNQFLGLLFEHDAYRSLKIGEDLIGYIKKVRDDKKIDLIISKNNRESHNELERLILNCLSESRGTLDITDKSNPKVIYDKFRVSKKQYKQALGKLYKKKLVNITAEKIHLV